MPNQPEAHLNLWTEANHLQNLDQSGVFDLFRLIQSPPTLQALFAHLPHLPEVLSASIQIAEISKFDASRYREAYKIASALKAHLPDLNVKTNLRELRPPVPRPRYGPCTGLLESHPLYSLLAEQVPHKDHRAPFTYLQAQVMLAMESLGPLDAAHLQPLLTPFRCIRDLTDHRHWKHLAKLPRQAMHVNDFAKRVEISFAKTKFQPIANIFRIASTGPTLRKRTRSIHREKEIRPSIHHLEDDEEVAGQYLREPSLATALQPEEAQSYTEHGGPPEELGPDSEFEAVLAKDRYHGPTRKQLAFQARQASNHRAMLNQFCGLAWNQASPFDLKVLFSHLMDKENQLDIDPDPLPHQEAGLLLALMTLTCNPLERLLSLPVHLKITPGPNGPEGLYWPDRHPPFIRLRSHGPDLAHRYAPKGAFPVEPFVHIPLAPHIQKRLQKLNFNQPGSLRPCALFPSIATLDDATLTAISTQLRSILGALNKDNGTRLSFGRISNYLVFRLAEKDRSDLPSALLFFGRNDKIAQTRIHYTVAPAENLEQAYRVCCNELFQLVGLDDQFDVEEKVNSGQHLGTPFCPLPETVRTLSQKLQSGIKASLKSTFDHRHNLFALYAAMLTSFGTGYRTVNDPSFQEIQIDFDNNLGVISDKGNLPYRTRYVYLAPVVLEQITLYRQHIQVVYGQIGLTSPSLFDLVKNLEFEGLPLNLFWLESQEMAIKVLGPGLTGKILSRHHSYDIPLNAGRHYLKYRLLEAGCSPELIEAQLGHWENGQEPWGPFSNLDPLEFSRQMSRYIPAILEQDGWRPVRGLA